MWAAAGGSPCRVRSRCSEAAVGGRDHGFVKVHGAFFWDRSFVFRDDVFDCKVPKYDYRGIGSGDHSGLGFWCSEYVAVAGLYTGATLYVT